MGFAIHGTIITQHLKDPIVSTLKTINVADALVSVVMTQCTLLAMEGPSNPVGNSALLGMGCSLLFVLLGISVLRKKKICSYVSEECE